MGFDLRRYARQANLRLAAGFFLLLFTLGAGLIWVIYGREAALLGLLCLVAGSVPLILVFAVLYVTERIVRKRDE